MHFWFIFPFSESNKELKEVCSVPHFAHCDVATCQPMRRQEGHARRVLVNVGL